VLTRPGGLTEGQIRAELAASCNFAAETLSYLPVGFASYHRRATDAAGRQLFLMVHDLPDMLHRRLDTAEAAFGRLETAFGCALSLRRDANLEFVICAGNHGQRFGRPPVVGAVLAGSLSVSDRLRAWPRW
jgi:hypothetical protein